MAISDAIRADYVLSLKTSSSDLSQSAFTDMIDVDTTPPTSSSGLSSQDVVSHIGESHATTKALGGIPAGIYTQRIPPPSLTSAGANSAVAAKSRSSSSSKSRPENVVIQGHKRTASGEIKTQNNAVGSRNPGVGGIRGHSRTTSTASNGNRIAEVCSQMQSFQSRGLSKYVPC
jgi:hypothetical protein